MIKPGDMVMVVWGCCPETREKIGRKGTVTSIGEESVKCFCCGRPSYPGQRVAFGNNEVGKRFRWPVAWLIRIDPPGVTTEKRETVEA